MMELTSYLDALPIYASNALQDSTLDPLRLLCKAGNYTWRQFPIPDAQNCVFAARATFEDQINVPPGSYLTQITGLSNNAAGYRLSVYDEGARMPIVDRDVLGGVVAGRGVLVPGGGVLQRTGPCILPSPLVVIEPGVLQVKITNLAAVAANLQLCFFFAQPTRPPDNEAGEHLALVAAEHAAIFKRRAGEREVRKGANSMMPDEGSQPFDHAGAINTPGIGAAAPVVQFIVPRGYTGVIRRFNCNVNAPFVEGSGDLIWRIIVAGKAVRNYDNILTQMGTTGSPRQVDGIVVDSGQIIQLTVDNIAYVVAGTQCYGSLAGSFFIKQGVRK